MTWTRQVPRRSTCNWCAEILITAADLLHVRNPAAQVQVTEVQLYDPLGPLRAGALDLQLTELPIDEPDVTVGPVVFSAPRALIVPVGHPFAERASVSLEDCAAEPMITVGGGAVPAYWHEHHYPSATPSGRVVPRGPVATYWHEILPLVSSGKGVSPTCLWAAPYFAHPGIVYVPFDDAPPIEYGILWPTARDTPAVRAFADIIRQAAARRTDRSTGQ